ncbi:MAG: hypothetical protein JZD40_04075 [Sulfolobus sp.]|nr:hypothetical protein [Sulfolobus sp.]
MSITAGLINYFMPYGNHRANFKVLKNKKVFLVSSLTAGVWGTYYVVSEYFPSFSFYVLHQSSIVAGSISSLLLLSSVIGGFFTFLLYRFREKTRVIVSSVLGVLPVLLLYKYYELGLILLGIFNEMAISVIYAFVIREVGSENSSLALAEANSLQIGLGSLELLLPYISLSNLWYLVLLASLLPLSLLLKVLD